MLALTSRMPSYVNTLVVQDVLGELAWAGVLTTDDNRGLTPLFWSRILPYGESKLNTANRLALSGPPTTLRRRKTADRAITCARALIDGLGVENQEAVA